MIPAIDFPAQMSNADAFEMEQASTNQNPAQRDDDHPNHEDNDDLIKQKSKLSEAREERAAGRFQQHPVDNRLEEVGVVDQYNDHDDHGHNHGGVEDDNDADDCLEDDCLLPKLVEKSVIVHRDENGFGLRFKGQCPVYVEHVHENGAAWRAGVRPFDTVSKVNGVPVGLLSHKDVVLMFKSCTRFVALTLLSTTSTSIGQSAAGVGADGPMSWAQASPPPPVNSASLLSRQPSTYSSAALSSSSDVRLAQHFHRTSSCNNSLRALAHRNQTTTTTTGRQWNKLGGQRPPSRDLSTTRSILNAAPLHNQSINQLELMSRQLVQGQQQHNRCRTQSTSSPSKQQQQLKVGRRDSNNSSEGNGQQQHQPPSSLDKRLAVCVFCRQSVVGATTTTTPNDKTGDSRGEAANGARRQFTQDLICSQCQDKHTGDMGGNKCAFSHMETHLTNRLHQLARDKTIGQLYKLSQSASTNSLPTVDQQMLSAGTPGGGGGGGGGARASITATKLKPSATSILISGSGRNGDKHVFVNKRVEIIREFIDTERTHTERLRCLDELFYRPLKQNGLMTHEQLRAVFSCHRTLYKIHRQIYRIMLSANYYHHPAAPLPAHSNGTNDLSGLSAANSIYASLAEPMVGSALLEIFEGPFKRRLERAACSFCSAQATNIELLNKLTRRDTKVGEFLAQVTSQQMVGRLGIKDLLATCFQRLTKYPLLLENLLKATPESPPPTVDLADELNSIGGGGGGVGGKQLNDNDDDDDDDPDSAFVVVRNDSDNYNDVDAAGGDTISTTNFEQPDIDNDNDVDVVDGDDDEEEEDQRLARQREEAARRLNSRRMLAISLAEEREFIERSLQQSRQILVRVNEAIRVAVSRHKLREIWKRTDKYPGVPLIDITKQQVVHEGLLTLRLSKRSFDVYVLLLNDYLIILTREGHDKYRLKFFTPEGKTAANNVSTGAAGASLQGVYSPVFVIDEHLTTRDAATDENGFYLLCKRKDDSRIYEFASRSPAERMKWRDRIQWTIERQMSRTSHQGGNQRIRRASCEGTLMTPKDSQTLARVTSQPCNELDTDEAANSTRDKRRQASPESRRTDKIDQTNSERQETTDTDRRDGRQTTQGQNGDDSGGDGEPTRFVGTISYVTEDEIVLPSRMGSYRIQVDQAIQVTNNTVI